jgi:hypothetical protein
VKVKVAEAVELMNNSGKFHWTEEKLKAFLQKADEQEMHQLYYQGFSFHRNACNWTIRWKRSAVITAREVNQK